MWYSVPMNQYAILDDMPPGRFRRIGTRGKFDVRQLQIAWSEAPVFGRLLLLFTVYRRFYGFHRFPQIFMDVFVQAIQHSQDRRLTFVRPAF